MTIKFALISQKCVSKNIINIPNKVHDEFNRSGLKKIINPYSRIGIAVSSRYIKRLRFILDQLITEILECNAKPFLIPAMGSHGGATAEGQKKILRNYGLDFKERGVPIYGSMETIKMSELENGQIIFFSKLAYKCDGIIVVNRIKEHTALSGKFQSGLLKMLTIGLGKKTGAIEIHKYGLCETIEKVGRYLINNTPIIAGLGIVENPYQEPIHIEIVNKDNILSREPELLNIALQNALRIPFRKLDFLILTEIGKDISGTCLDLNVVERGIKYKNRQNPKIKTIIALDLTLKSQGNATGIGYADLITDRLLSKIDRKSIYKNCMTSNHYEAAKIPIAMQNIEEIFNKVIMKYPRKKIAILKNTLEMNNIYVSNYLSDEIRENNNLKQISLYKPIKFINGNLDYPKFL